MSNVIMNNPSDWFLKHFMAFKAGGDILDVACGAGRHSVFLKDKGYQVTAVDIDIAALKERSFEDITLVQADLEAEAWPFGDQQFDGIVVVNYLWRPLFEELINSLKPGGVIIFDTFAVGNERFGRPRNPDFLLRQGELRDVFAGFDIQAWEEGVREKPSPSVRQSIVARKPV